MDIKNNEEENEITECPDIVEGAQNYLAGWVAKKHLKKYPFLGDYTYKSESSPANERSWIRHLSKGGLVEPSEQWIQISQVCEQEFNIFHGEKRIKKDINIVKDLVAKVSQKVEHFPLEVITSYIKMRTIIRMKDLNLNLCATKFKKRQGDVDLEKRKRIKK
ncbi:uncharacterized protein LOC124369548 [Homalodisca vitripennis]|uniref:uncharacterized protein LOC124369548 n=1 Tax=Homalodisca vitripennis TaxID=197043 RepID=UPI001EEBB2EA|nr:uncharacterized protein LOC124369548 [Homalodisca vitripennis]